MSEHQWRDFGDGKLIRVKICMMCGVAPTNVDDCGEFGNPECPYFGIGLEEYGKLHKDTDMQELLKDKARLGVQIMADNVNPDHYKKGGIECIEAIKAATAGKAGIEAVCTANVIKYVWRYEDKNGIEDLRKALWYFERPIKEVTEK